MDIKVLHVSLVDHLLHANRVAYTMLGDSTENDFIFGLRFCKMMFQRLKKQILFGIKTSNLYQVILNGYMSNGCGTKWHHPANYRVFLLIKQPSLISVPNLWFGETRRYLWLVSCRSSRWSLRSLMWKEITTAAMIMSPFSTGQKSMMPRGLGSTAATALQRRWYCAVNAP